MSRLTWTERKHYGGVDRGAVYSRNGSVEAWNGLISVTEKPSDIRERVRHRDGMKTINQRVSDSFSATAECWTYPQLLSNHRTIFDFSYRSRTSTGYEIHLVYNALAHMTGVQYAQDEASPLTFDIWTRPRAMPLERMPSAHLIIDSSEAYPPVVAAFEDLLYGDGESDPRFPDPEELITIFDINALFQVVDNGDGTATISAPDEVFEWLSDTHAIADWPYVNNVDEDTVRIRNF
jgi:hypothetical protein